MVKLRKQRTTETMLWIIVFLVVIVVGSVATISVLKSKYGQREQVWLPNENYFVDPNDGNKRIQFPSVYSNDSNDRVYVSLIVPAYNEQERLPIMLDETIQYLKQREAKDSSFTWEIIIVDDGSKDKTTQVALGYCRKEGIRKFRVLTLLKNRGKGGAVKRGMLCARGQYLLMVDADGATKISDLDRLERDTKFIETKGLAIGIGSRAHMQADAVASRTALRKILSGGFHLLVSTLGIRGIKDTQCGFKLFSREAARLLFVNQNVERWAFDCELLFLAQQFGIPMVETAVNWMEIEGSKLTPFAASVQMAKDLLRIRAFYLFGIWTANQHRKSV